MKSSKRVQRSRLSPIAVKLIEAGVSHKAALRIADRTWDAVDADALPPDRDDFAAYIDEKIGLSRHAVGVKNAGGFIVKAIRENYQDPVFQKQLQAEKQTETRAMLESLRNEMLEKQNALLRQAIRTTPGLLERAAAKITSAFIRERLADYESIQAAYNAGGIVAGEIHSILAEEFCADLIAPVLEMYEAEKQRLEASLD